MKAFLAHRRARFDYDILDTYEAGIVLLGTETKSVRSGRGKLEGAHVIVRGGEAFLVGASINAWQTANAPAGYEPERARKLLLSHKQIAELSHKSDKEGLTIVPLMMYNSGKSIKVSLGIARGKKTRDKRENTKERETKRTISRILKRSQD